MELFHQSSSIRIRQTEDSIELDQTGYIDEVLQRFGMDTSKPVLTPLNVSEKLTKEMSPTTDEDRLRMARVPYREAVGCLNYIAQSTQPDIVYTVNTLSRFNNDPGEKHWQAVKHLLRYLKGTADYCLKFDKNSPGDVVGYSDADWAADIDSRSSVSGFVFVAQGGAISWASKRQKSVATSSCEAEYYALSSACQEALWWKGIKSQIEKDEPIKILCDNQSAISVANNQGFNPRLKHIDIRYKFVMQHIEQGDIKLEYVSTNEQAADILTKALDRVKTQKFRTILGIVPHSI